MLQAAVLFASAGVAAWAAVTSRHRKAVPGSHAFGWLMVAVAHWCLTAALETLVIGRDAQILIAKVQYLGIVATGPLWLAFTSAYSRAEWLKRRALRTVLWVVPILTVTAAATNQWHHALWASITVTGSPGGRLVYEGGPWYWVNVGTIYVQMAIGIGVLAGGLRRFPPLYRGQTWAILIGALVPWVGNAAYHGGLLPPGIDPTPIAFAASGLCFAWGLFRCRLFDLVPVARETIMNSMTDGVMVLDAQRRIIDFNAAAERYTGCTSASLGEPVDEVVSWWTEAVHDDQPPGDQPTIVRTDPGQSYFEVSVSPLLDHGSRFAGWLVVVHDISARRRHEAERYALGRRVQEQQKSESLVVLASGVAHDFNNLLTGILGNADLLAMQAPPDSAERRAAEAVVIGAQRAADLVSKMLAYSGGGRVVAQHVDLDTLVREMVDLLDASVVRHCALSYNSPGPLPMVETDPAQIRQVVLNLIVNATEAVDDHGVVTVETGEDTLDRGTLHQMTFGADVPPGRYVFIDVVDNGHGMDDDTLARVFDPFFSTKEAGRGLGMAAVRGIVRSHHAALRVTTAVGQGTRFRVWFPLVVSRPKRDLSG